MASSSTMSVLDQLLHDVNDCCARLDAYMDQELTESTGGTLTSSEVQERLDALYKVLSTTAMRVKPSGNVLETTALPEFAAPPLHSATSNDPPTTAVTDSIPATNTSSTDVVVVPALAGDTAGMEDVVRTATQTHADGAVRDSTSQQPPEHLTLDLQHDHPRHLSPPSDQQVEQRRSPSQHLQAGTEGDNTPDTCSLRSPPMDSRSVAPQGPPTIDENNVPTAGDRKASLRRSTASRIHYNVPAGKPPSSKKSNRRSCRTTGVSDLHNIAAELGCGEVSDAIRDLISRVDEPPSMSFSGQSSQGISAPGSSMLSHFVGVVQRAIHHTSSEWTTAVCHRHDVVFLHRFYTAACEEVSETHHSRRSSAFDEWSASLLQQHHRQATTLPALGPKSATRVKDRLIDLMFLDGRSDTQETRRSMRHKLENVHTVGRRWRYLTDNVHPDVLILLPASVTDKRIRLNTYDLKQLGQLLQLQRKALSAQVLDLARIADEQLFQPRHRQHEEAFGVYGRWSTGPPLLHDRDSDVVMNHDQPLEEISNVNNDVANVHDHLPAPDNGHSPDEHTDSITRDASPDTAREEEAANVVDAPETSVLPDSSPRRTIMQVEEDGSEPNSSLSEDVSYPDMDSVLA